jgi:hypothetical protein
MKVKMRSASTVKLYNASGKKMLVIREAEIIVKIPEIKRKETINFQITEDQRNTDQRLIRIRVPEQLKLLPFNRPENLDFPTLKVCETTVPAAVVTETFNYLPPSSPS